VVGEEHARDDPGALRVYARDATPLHHGAPDAVVFPRSAAEVSGGLRQPRTGLRRRRSTVRAVHLAELLADDDHHHHHGAT
jgi:hypothetical protein